MKRILVLLVSLALIAVSCKKDNVDPSSDLASLPPDTGGTHAAKTLGSDGSPYGYYLYTPSGYTSSGPKFPLLVFLHGSGEIGNSQTKAADLDKVLANGPPKLITQGKWSPKYPMVVASIQCHESWWDVNKVRDFVNYMRENYRIDTARIYMTGLSMGGFGTYDQITVWGAQSHLAAVVTIAGGGAYTDFKAQKASTIPLWAFHGEADNTVLPDFDKQMVQGINKLNPSVKARLTMYAGVGHDSWTRTYDGTGMGKEDAAYDPFNMDIYSWMFQYTNAKKK